MPRHLARVGYADSLVPWCNKTITSPQRDPLAFHPEIVTCAKCLKAERQSRPLALPGQSEFVFPKK